MLGALTNFVSNSQTSLRVQNKKNFQPMTAIFGLLPELDLTDTNKRERYKKYRDRALGKIQNLKDTFLDKNSITTSI